MWRWRCGTTSRGRKTGVGKWKERDGFTFSPDGGMAWDCAIAAHRRNLLSAVTLVRLTTQVWCGLRFFSLLLLSIALWRPKVLGEDLLSAWCSSHTHDSCRNFCLLFMVNVLMAYDRKLCSSADKGRGRRIGRVKLRYIKCLLRHYHPQERGKKRSWEVKTSWSLFVSRDYIPTYLPNFLVKIFPWLYVSS